MERDLRACIPKLSKEVNSSKCTKRIIYNSPARLPKLNTGPFPFVSREADQLAIPERCY
jgi:hypothetical protein